MFSMPQNRAPSSSLSQLFSTENLPDVTTTIFFQNKLPHELSSIRFNTGFIESKCGKIDVPLSVNKFDLRSYRC